MSIDLPDRRMRCSLAVAALVLAFARLAGAQSPPEPAVAAGATAQVLPAEPAPMTVPSSAVPTAAPAPAAQERPGRWTQKLYSWGSVGTTFAYGQTYGSANIGVGFLLQHGIAPNVELGYAFGNSPTFGSARPGLTWFMPIPFAHPYVGAYYTHRFVGGNQPDLDGIGGRAGFSLGRVISLGVTYDHAIGCSQNCDSWAPQISAGLSL